MPRTLQSNVIDSGRVLTITDKLFLAAIVLSPFQGAFTVDVGFPLKPSEILIIVGVISFPFVRRRARGRLPAESLCVLALGLLVVLSSVYHLLIPNPPGPYPGYTRGITFDLSLYLGYSILVFALWFFTAGLDPHYIRRAFLFAMWLCAAATALQWVLWQFNLQDVLATLGYQIDRTGTAFGGNVPRTGPFVEGQHLGFFSGLCLFIALRERKPVVALLSIGCLLYSQSTTAFIAAIVALFVGALLRMNTAVVARVLLALAGLTAATLAIPQVQQFVIFQLGKSGLPLFGVQQDITRSVTLRTEKSGVAWQMAADHPILGVGPGRFGVWFQQYAIPQDFPGNYFDGSSRPIVENGYLQLAAEIGIIALVVFGIFVVALSLRGLRAHSMELSFAIFILISISTLSSWTFIPLWLGLGYLAAMELTPRGSPLGQTTSLSPTLDPVPAAPLSPLSPARH